MRISELVASSGVPLPTVKYYLREGLLHPGHASSATQASYDDTHLRRLGLIRALTDVVGLSVQNARTVLRLIDEPTDDLLETLGRAIGALPPYPTVSATTVPATVLTATVPATPGPAPTVPATTAPDAADFPRARAALERLGQVYDPRYAAVAQLERALAAAEAAGMPVTNDRLDAYGKPVMAIAEFDIDQAPGSPERAVEYSVLGTALYEPVLAALRRLAHQDAALRRLAQQDAARPRLAENRG